MKSMISRSVLWAGLSLLLIAAAIGVGQSAATMLSDAEAQALIRKYQGQPGTPLTRIETQRPPKYFIAKNSNLSPSTAMQSQTQSGVASTNDCTTDSAVTGPGHAELKKRKLTRIGVALPKADLGQGYQGQSAGESLRLLESQYLQGPKIEVVMLTSLLESQVEVEAKENACDCIPFSTRRPQSVDQAAKLSFG